MDQKEYEALYGEMTTFYGRDRGETGVDSKKFVDLGELLSDVNLKTLYPNLPDTHTFYGIICNPDITAAMNQLPTIRNDVRQMIGYKQRAQAVESYFECIENSDKFGNNIEQNWRDFYNEKQQA
jgi:hypothetical protein